MMLLLGKHQFIVSSIDGPGIGDPRSPNKSSSSAMSNSLQGQGQGEYEYLNSNSKNKNRPSSSGRRNNASMVRFFLQFDFRFTF